MNARQLIFLSTLCLPLSGCIGGEAEADLAGSVADAGPQETRFVSLRKMALTLDAMQEEGRSIPISVPDGSLQVILDLRYGNGAYNEARFTLGGCQGVTPAEGLVVHEPGVHVNAIGSWTDGNVQFPCGDLPSGPQEVTWDIEAGRVDVELQVFAEVPA